MNSTAGHALPLETPSGTQSSRLLSAGAREISEAVTRVSWVTDGDPRRRVTCPDSVLGIKHGPGTGTLALTTAPPLQGKPAQDVLLLGPVKTRHVNPLKPTAPHLPPHPSVSLSLSVSCLGGGGSSTVCLCQSPDLSPERVHCTVRKLYLNHVQLEKTNWIKIRIIS